MARHCAKWVSGRKSKKHRGRGRGRKGHCQFGKVKRGRRKGQCLKTRRARGGTVARQIASMWKSYKR